MNAPQALIDLIRAESDVKALHRLEWCEAQKCWLYLIETPFKTYPRFVVGWTDETATDVRRIVSCGLRENADEHFALALEIARRVPGLEEVMTTLAAELEVAR